MKFCSLTFSRGQIFFRDIINKIKFNFLEVFFIMKNFCCAVLFLFFAAGTSFAGEDPVVYVLLDNVETAEGGNASVGGPFHVDEIKGNSHLAVMDSRVSFEEAYAHGKFQYENKSKSLAELRQIKANICIFPNAKQVARIKANTVPSKKVLLNANAPIVITSFSDKIRLCFLEDVVGGARNPFDGYNYDCGTEFARMLDAKGKAIATLQGVTAGKYSDVSGRSVEVNVSPEYKDYYLEIKDSRGGKYYYVLLKMRATEIPAKKNSFLAETDSNFAKRGKLRDEVTADYMKKHNIKDPNSLTPEDDFSISEMIEDREATNSIKKKHLKARRDYMKKHGIKDNIDLTDEDQKNIDNAFKASLTPSEKKELYAEGDAVLEILQSYMKKHSIPDESKMTQKDWAEINKEISEKLGKTLLE